MVYFECGIKLCYGFGVLDEGLVVCGLVCFYEIVVIFDVYFMW